MCLILFGWRVHPGFPLVLAANRDEFHARDAAPVQWWPDQPQLLAGRDLKAGGTWLAVTRDGQMAALTNFRSPDLPRPRAPSRGELVVRMADSRMALDDRLHWLRAHAAEYPHFNMVISDSVRLAIFESATDSCRFLNPGVYGLSNHLLDTPWPKVQTAKSSLAIALNGDSSDERLLHLLRDDQRVPEDQLPRTGISIEWEELLSSAFVRGGTYGTRCSTVIRVGADQHIDFREWTWDAGGAPAGDVRYRFKITPPLVPRV